MHVTKSECKKIEDLYQAAGKKFIPDFMRELILNEHKSNSIINNVELIKRLDVIGKEFGRIGNNINQLAKYANIQIKTGKVDPKTMVRFSNQMDIYLQERRKMTKSYRALARNE